MTETETATHRNNGVQRSTAQTRRSIEREYVAVLSDVVPLDVWRDVVQKAVDDAKAGDARARDWLTRQLLGTGTPSVTLSTLASLETAGIDPADDVARDAIDVRQNRELGDLLRRAGAL
jgi:hypothetical protein